MSPNLATVFAAAESLSVAERCQLIDLLLEGLEDSPSADAGTPVLTEAWRQEIVQRSAEYDAGQAETVTWQEEKIHEKSTCNQKKNSNHGLYLLLGNYC